jgi:hypothetical protein
MGAEPERSTQQSALRMTLNSTATGAEDVSDLAQQILSLIKIAGAADRPFLIIVVSPYFRTYWLLRTFLKLPSLPSVSVSCHQGLVSDYLIEICRRSWPP